MRKYILAIILLLSGLTLLIVNFINIKNPVYTEEIFAKQATLFEQNFDLFTNQVRETIFTIKSDYTDTLKIKDSLTSSEYFLSLLDHKELVNSVAYFQGDYKLIAKKEDLSRVFALDSMSDFGVVRWNRIENGNLKSSWFESLEASVYNTSWYKDIIETKEQLKWYLRKKGELDNSGNEQTFFYAAYAYMVNNTTSVIVLEFSKIKLIDAFNLNNKKLNPRLSLFNHEAKELKLNTAGINNQETDQLESATDSLQIIIDRHFSNFKDVDQGNFNFNFKNKIFWTSFKRFPQSLGINYYLYTIPNQELISASTRLLNSYGGKAGFALMIIGGFLLMIKKRFFYTPNRMPIPAVRDVLRKDENRYLEFKSSLRWDYRQEKTNPELEKVIMKTIAAFGNTDGGILLIGVDDDKNILGLENDFQTLKKNDADYYEVHIRNIMHKLMGVKYVSKYIRTQFEILEGGKIVCIIKVISAKEPLYLKFKNKNGQEEEKFYVRSGNSSHEIKSIAEINDYINTKFK